MGPGIGLRFSADLAAAASCNGTASNHSGREAGGAGTCGPFRSSAEGDASGTVRSTGGDGRDVGGAAAAACWRNENRPPTTDANGADSDGATAKTTTTALRRRRHGRQQQIQRSPGKALPAVRKALLGNPRPHQ